jgi:GlpG protein
MRLIGTLPTDTDATRFGDYLLSIALPNHVEAGRDGSWQVWIDHDDHLEQATSQLHAYLANPNDPKYAAAMSAAIKVRREAAAEAERRRKKHVDVRTSWSGAKVLPTPVAIAMVVICLLVGGLTRFSMDAHEGTPGKTIEALQFQPVSAVLDVEDPMAAAWAVVRGEIGHGRPMTMFSSIANGQVWRLITPIFLHGDLLHLVFNLTWVISLGRMIEMRKGSLFLGLLIIGAAIASNCGEALWAVYGPENKIGYQAFGGFSGVNYALFGYAWIKGRFQPYELMGVNPQTVGLMLAWLVLCVLHVIPNVANAAHVVGLAVGVAIGYAPTLRRKMKR